MHIAFIVSVLIGLLAVGFSLLVMAGIEDDSHEPRLLPDGDGVCLNCLEIHADV